MIFDISYQFNVSKNASYEYETMYTCKYFLDKFYRFFYFSFLLTIYCIFLLFYLFKRISALFLIFAEVISSTQEKKYWIELILLISTFAKIFLILDCMEVHVYDRGA